MQKNSVLLVAAFAGSFFAQGAMAQCSDAGINAAFLHWGQKPLNASECVVTRYGGATWNSYGATAQQMLNGWVSNSRLCTNDAWIGEAFWTASGRSANPAAGECNPALYGSWSSFPQLVGLVKMYTARSALFPIPVSWFNIETVMGTKCLNIEGAKQQAGARVILFDCNSGSNEHFKLANGQIQAFEGTVNLCVNDYGGKMTANDSIAVVPCNQSATRWKFIGGKFQVASPATGVGMCIDLRTGWFFGNTDLLLKPCGQNSQNFEVALTLPQGTSTSMSATGVAGASTPRVSVLISQDGSSIVASGAGNVVSNDGGSIVASGAGNMILGGGYALVSATALVKTQ